MKKLTLLAIVVTLALTSCTEETTIQQICQPQSYHWETITCDTEDNIIKIDNQWLHNSNLDWDNWQYFQTRGFRLDDRQLRVVTTDGSKILQAELFNVNPDDLYITRPNDSTVIFYSSNTDLMNAGDVYYVNLKIANN